MTALAEVAVQTHSPATAPIVVATPEFLERDEMAALLSELSALRGLLRIAANGDYDSVSSALQSLVGTDRCEATVEIRAEEIRAVACPGEFVLAPWGIAAELVARGCVPLDQLALPKNAATAAGRLAAATGWIRLEWIAECRMGSGYADEARMFLRALDEAGVEPVLTGYPNPAPRVPLGGETERLLRRCEARQAPPQSAVSVWHEKPIDPALLEGRRWPICRTMFETDSLPTEWVWILNRYHRVWVPTVFNVETFERAGVRPSLLRVLPETIDLTRFTPDAPPRQLTSGDDFTFLSNFAFQERKGWRELLMAYVLEFAGDDSVTLALKITNPFVQGDEIHARVDAFVRQLGVPAHRVPRIEIIRDTFRDTDMPGIYTAVDAYVSPTRGEGWGRPLMEALACGLPTIASRWSGHLAFLDDSCAWLVDGEIVPVPDEIDNETFRGQNWFAPDIDALRSAMRLVVGDPAGSRARAPTPRPRLEADFGLPRIAERISELTLEAIAC